VQEHAELAADDRARAPVVGQGFEDVAVAVGVAGGLGQPEDDLGR
jgi:hypothetical protein